MRDFIEKISEQKQKKKTTFGTWFRSTTTNAAELSKSFSSCGRYCKIPSKKKKVGLANKQEGFELSLEKTYPVSKFS